MSEQLQLPLIHTQLGSQIFCMDKVDYLGHGMTEGGRAEIAVKQYLGQVRRSSV